MERQVVAKFREAYLVIVRRSSFEPANFSWVIEGKLAGGARPESEEQLRWLKEEGVQVIVCLNMERPLDEQQVKGLGFEYLFIPVRDFTAPRLEDIERFVSFTKQMLKQSKPVVVCCAAGIGRTGTMLAAYLVSVCLSPDEALERVRVKRGMGVESTAQKEAVYEFARRMGKCHKHLFRS